MTQQKDTSGENWTDEAQFYLQGMSMENSLLQSYRMIFGGIEAILFLIWSQQEVGHPLVILFGIVFCVAWVLVCLHRGREVTAWRKELIEVTRRTKAGHFIHERFELKPRPVLQARFWLSLLPLGLIVLWLYLAFSCLWGWLGMLLFEVVLLLVLWRVREISLFRL